MRHRNSGRFRDFACASLDVGYVSKLPSRQRPVAPVRCWKMNALQDAARRLMSFRAQREE
jgi:hypothetical protein